MSLIIKYYYKDGTSFEGSILVAKTPSKILHREDGPAMEFSDGDYGWYLNGILHRVGGPAEEIDGVRLWWVNGLPHREDGPAIEHSNGSKDWFIDGKRHREDGPAVEWSAGYRGSDGYRAWYINGKGISILPQDYLIRYMELTGETLATLLISSDPILRDSVKKYKWKELE